MDITSLLSPESSLLQSETYAEDLETSAQTAPASKNCTNAAIALLDRQIAALSATAPGRRVTTAKKRAQIKFKASFTLAGTDVTTDTNPPPVKRKRKRRPTVKQLQIIHENRHDDFQLYNLTLDVNDLKQQVRDLLVHRSIYETRVLVAIQRFNVGVLRTTKQFFQVFRTGFREWEPHEAAFLTAIMDYDVALGSIARGTTIFFDQWRRYKKLLQQRSSSITSTHILVSDSESCMVECEGEFEGRLTLPTIKMLFPHILQDQQLLERVVNRRFVCPTRTMINFDGSGRIVEYNAQVDMFAGLNRILKSTLKDVITLMSNAHLGSNSSIASDETDSDRVESSRFSDPEVLEASSKDKTGRRGFGWKESASPVSSIASSSSSVTSASSRSSVEYILS